MIVTEEKRRFVLQVDEKLKERIHHLLGNRKLTLASGSPRRKEILGMLGLEFDVIVPKTNEVNTNNCSPHQYASEIALKKLADIDKKGGIIITADTIVVHGDNILGKPNDDEDAMSILQLLSGKRHYVVTALTLHDCDSGKTANGAGTSYVTFRKLDHNAISDYVSTGEPLDKAGAYGIQGMGEFLVEKLEGELDNVIGFPVNVFAGLLEELI